MVALKWAWPRGLHGQLALMLGLVAAGPALLAVALSSLLLSEAYEEEHKARVLALTEAVEREGVLTKERLDRVARELVEGPVLDPWLTDSLVYDDGSRKDVQEMLEALRVASAIQVLTVQDARGTVLACAHLPARVGEDLPLPPAGGPRYGTVTVVEGERLKDVPAMLLARRTELKGRALSVEVGVRLDDPFADRVTSDPDARIWLMKPGSPPPESRKTHRALPQQLVQMATVQLGHTVVHFGVALEDAQVDEKKRDLKRATMAVAILLVVLAAVLGGVLASRASRPLLDLREATQRFGHGERVVVPETGPAEVAAVGAAFNQMVADVEEARSRALQAERVAAWQQVARRMAHEVKNPLFPIQTSVETLIKARERHLPQEQEIFEETTRTILEEVARLSRIVTEFSSFARMPEAVPTSVDAVDVAQNVVHLMGTAHAAAVELAAPETSIIHADKDQLHRLLLNLVKNAVEAVAPKGATGRVDVSISDTSSPHHAVIKVRDNGPGIPPEVKERLFTPYVTTKPDGTGLGLAMVHRIAIDHGAEVNVETSDHGTTFSIRWPRPGAPRFPSRPPHTPGDSARGAAVVGKT